LFLHILIYFWVLWLGFDKNFHKFFREFILTLNNFACPESIERAKTEAKSSMPPHQKLWCGGKSFSARGAAPAKFGGQGSASG